MTTTIRLCACGARVPKHCVYCSPECRPSDYRYSPCHRCGGPKRRVRGVKLCNDCAAEGKRSTNRRKNARRRNVRKFEFYTLTEIAVRDSGRCHLCRRKVDMSLSGMAKWGPTIDHIIPVSAGGTDAVDNVALAHRHCNCCRQDTGPAQLRLAV